MSNPKILVYYHPRLYAELFSSVLKSLCGIEIIESNHDSSAESIYRANRLEADIIITSLDEDGQLTMNKLPAQAPRSKVLAFTPSGKLGMKRMPNSNQWEKISPFGLDQLIREVIYLIPKTQIHN